MNARRQRERSARVHSLFNPPHMTPTGDMAAWRHRLYEVVFEAETPAGRFFDLALLLLILSSIAAVMLESVTAIEADYGDILRTTEWVLTGLFTLEYGLRLLCVRRPSSFAFSFFGIVDLMAIAPSYASLFVEGAQALVVIRVLRVLRVFRLMRLHQFVDETELLARAMVASLGKITVFLGTVLSVVVIMGASMFIIEGEAGGFDNIPRSVYWAIVTLTTVGYGDIAPQTPAGQALASAVMILGYAIIAVPTGIVTAEISRQSRATDAEACATCGTGDHADDAKYCRRCGETLLPEPPKRKPAPIKES